MKIVQREYKIFKKEKKKILICDLNSYVITFTKNTKTLSKNETKKIFIRNRE